MKTEQYRMECLTPGHPLAANEIQRDAEQLVIWLREEAIKDALAKGWRVVCRRQRPLDELEERKRIEG